MSFNDSPDLQSTKLVLVLADLAGYAREFRNHADEAMATFIGDFYDVCAEAIRSRDGRVVKFIGDSCLAVFAGDRGEAAVEALLGMTRDVARLATDHHLDVVLGANVHCGTVVEGLYGPEGLRRYDIIGSAMNHTALMGRGPGLRISEPVYRQLPSGGRAPWRKIKPPATYVYTDR